MNTRNFFEQQRLAQQAQADNAANTEVSQPRPQEILTPELEEQIKQNARTKLAKALDEIAEIGEERLRQI